MKREQERRELFRGNLRLLTEFRGMTREEAPRRIGVDPRWYRFLLTTGINKPTAKRADDIRRIADFFGLTPRDLWREISFSGINPLTGTENLAYLLASDLVDRKKLAEVIEWINAEADRVRSILSEKMNKELRERKARQDEREQEKRRKGEEGLKRREQREKEETLLQWAKARIALPRDQNNEPFPPDEPLFMSEKKIHARMHRYFKPEVTAIYEGESNPFRKRMIVKFLQSIPGELLESVSKGDDLAQVLKWIGEFDPALWPWIGFNLEDDHDLLTNESSFKEWAKRILNSST